PAATRIARADPAPRTLGLIVHLSSSVHSPGFVAPSGIARPAAALMCARRDSCVHDVNAFRCAVRVASASHREAGLHALRSRTGSDKEGNPMLRRRRSLVLAACAIITLAIAGRSGAHPVEFTFGGPVVRNTCAGIAAQPGDPWEMTYVFESTSADSNPNAGVG